MYCLEYEMTSVNTAIFYHIQVIFSGFFIIYFTAPKAEGDDAENYLFYHSTHLFVKFLLSPLQFGAKIFIII